MEPSMNAQSVAEPTQADLDAERAPGAEASASTQDAENEEEDPNECGWCKWMKAGGCQAPFTSWLACVDDIKAQGRDDVEVCAKVMGPLFECMERHKEYYSPQLETLQLDKSDDDVLAGEAEQPVGKEHSQPTGDAATPAATQ